MTNLGNVMKLYERLNLKPNIWQTMHKIESVEIAKNIRPDADSYDRAWKKFELPDCLHLLSLAYYYSDEKELTTEHANQCISELEEFFFGEWRNRFETPEKKLDPGWWKRGFIWMQLFEAAVLWGSILGKWDFLKRVGEFPELDSCISDGYRPVDRDLYVAWAAFLREASPNEIRPLLERVQSGKSRRCKLVLALLRAGLARDVAEFEKALILWFKYYREEEFPKEKITKKISIEGTFFVHWAEMKGLTISVPEDFVDHIVRLK